jgi:3-dehydroquinate dehydratase/shikimate dehydrogenase
LTFLMPHPQLCLTVTAPTMAELCRQRDTARDVDLVELRLDTVSDPDVAAALRDRAKPVIVTCRAAWEGGEFKGSETERKAILRQAIDAGAEYVDIEFRAGFTDLLALNGGRGIIVSSHDFDAMPADLVERARDMRRTGAEVIKLAARTATLSDCVTLLAASRDEEAASGKSVWIGMGPAGLPTRALAWKFGNAWTYAGRLRGVGQISADTLLREYRYRWVDELTSVYGLTGSPIAHSVSPAMHNTAIAAAEIDAVYLPLPAEDADDFLRFAQAFDVQGASVTIPFKVSLRERIDDVDAIGRQVGAINTIRRQDGRWAGRNTDVPGFLQPLKDRHTRLRGARVSILGSGGSARGVAVALVNEGATVTVHGRDAARAARVAAAAGCRAGDFPPPAGSWDLLVNCTPVGMHPEVDATPIDQALLSGGLVYDLIYNPGTTRLLREAHEAGCEVIGGLDMLVAQAALQFEWWTGVRPSRTLLRAAALDRLAEFEEQ